MKKFLVKLALKRKSVAVKIQTGRFYVIQMTGNSNFSTPVPSLASVTTAINELETANEDALDGGKALKAILRGKRAAYELKMTALGDYVDNIAQGSETIIKSAGMDTRAIPAPVGVPEQVKNLEAAQGKLSGEADLRWKNVKGAKIYFVYISPDVDNSGTYELVATPTASKVTLVGLTPGKVYYFKVKAVGTAGAGAPSDPAKLMVV